MIRILCFLLLPNGRVNVQAGLVLFFIIENCNNYEGHSLIIADRVPVSYLPRT